MPDLQPDSEHGTSQMDQSESHGLKLTIVADPCINLAMQQNRVPLVKEISLENLTDKTLTDICVRVVAEPEFSIPIELRVDSIEPRGRHIWSKVNLQPSPSFLAGLNERLDGVLHIHVSSKDGSPFVEHRPVSVLAYDQWGGLQSLPELLAAFVLPNHPALVSWLRRAASILEVWTKDPSLSGYQSKSRERVMKISAAVFHSIQESGVTYVNPPASFESTGQKVRTADRIEEEKLGTCIDLALLAVACLEQAGLHPMVIVVRGHAFAGVWLDDSTFAEPATEDSALLVKRIQLGEIAVFDPTLATNRPATTFAAAIESAHRSLARPEEFHCVVDVVRSRKGGIVPLPLRAHGVELEPLSADSRVEAPDEAPEIAIPRVLSGDTGPETPASRIDRWKRRLLDLTNRNRLLNFVESKKTVAVASLDLGRIEDLLADGDVLTLREQLPEMSAKGADGRPVPQETIDRLVAAELASNRLVTRLDEENLTSRLTGIYRGARQGLEEGGASSLYIALGFLEWFENDTSDQPRRAPLLLVPVDLQRGSIRAGFKLSRSGDETRFNNSLLHKIHDDFGVEIEGIDPLPEDDHGVDVDAVMQRVTSAIRDVRRWRVLHQAQLGFFTFSKFLMWNDLDKHSEQLLQNPVVSHLVRNPEKVFDTEWEDPASEDLDVAHPTEKLNCPVIADSSQLAAVLAAADGKSFVLEGPPGTGKSQTITNVVAHCLASGKTILFVSEKTAALNVVFDRLKRIGLERFCLELHSNKANKLEVVRRFGEALNGTREAPPADWSILARDLDAVRHELNTYARAISRLHANGLSPFRATSILSSLRAVPFVRLDWPDVAELDRERLAGSRSLIRDAGHTIEAIGEPRDHALAGIGITDVAAETPTKIREVLARLRRELDVIPKSIAFATDRLAIDAGTATLSDLRGIDLAARAALDAPVKGWEMLACDPEETERLTTELCVLGRKRDEARTVVEQHFDRSINALDLKGLRTRVREAEETWFLPRFLRTRKIRGSLNEVTKPDAKPSLGDIRDAIDRTLELAEVEPRLVMAAAALRERTQCTWNVVASPWTAAESAAKWCRELVAAVRVACDSCDATNWIERIRVFVGAIRNAADWKRQLQECRQSLAKLFAAADAVASLLKLSTDDAWNSATEPNRLASWRSRIDRIERSLLQLKNWALWRRKRAELIQARLEPLVLALERGEFAGRQFAAAFERAFCEEWLAVARSADPVLRDFLALSHEQRIARFRELDDRCTQMARKVVSAKLSSRLPNGSIESVPNSELGVLKRQLQLQRRHLGPRKLLQQTKTLAQRLKPCFLMSPISVAQYLPPGAFQFDVVVFDEASQIPTWDAVGAIARGKQAVVVGDSKQLPPTSFFESAVQEESDAPIETEELDSILNECRAANLPAMDLRWHYRSQHESLIAFSNRKYYENRLHTFPSAQFDGLGVQWRFVSNGIYDKSKSRTNQVEATALVDEILRRLRDHFVSKPSIGVVTFSSAQQTMVEDLLDAARRADPSLDQFFIATAEVPEPVFVKNLENVQGDERDVILFSICYGPDALGRIAMNFGPINQQGGEKRLNVAVTRARRELLVFSSIHGDQIDTNRTRARGVADLKAFLEYAERGLSAIPAETTTPDADDFDSPLEQEICSALREKGHTIRSQVGCSGYRIDLAVVDDERPGNYLLGIECDGRNYHSARTARERDRLRQSVLESLGWRLVRVWSSDWWEARDAQIERICRAIDASREDAKVRRKRAPAPPPAPIIPTMTMRVPAPTPAKPATSALREQETRNAPVNEAPSSIYAGATTATTSSDSASTPFRPYCSRPVSRLGSHETFYDSYQSKRIEQELIAVVEAEGPITLELAAVRVARAFSFGRTTQGVVERIVTIARSAGITRTEIADRIVLWPKSLDPKTWREYRTSAPDDADSRDADDLPVQEVANAASHALSLNGACPRRDLQRALSRVFGFRSLGSTLAKHLDAGIDHLIADGRARLDGDGRVEPIH